MCVLKSCIDIVSVNWNKQHPRNINWNSWDWILLSFPCVPYIPEKTVLSWSTSSWLYGLGACCSSLYIWLVSVCLCVKPINVVLFKQLQPCIVINKILNQFVWRLADFRRTSSFTCSLMDLDWQGLHFLTWLIRRNHNEAKLNCQTCLWNLMHWE